MRRHIYGSLPSRSWYQLILITVPGDRAVSVEQLTQGRYIAYLAVLRPRVELSTSRVARQRNDYITAPGSGGELLQRLQRRDIHMEIVRF